ncbi:MAG TPA: hypothetical protein VGI86_13780, partial [Acidimicrobiia bacterium]
AFSAAIRDQHVTHVLLERSGGYVDDTGVVQTGVVAQLAHDHVVATVPAAGDRGIFTPQQIDHDSARGPVFLIAGRTSLFAPPGTLLADRDPLSANQQAAWKRDYLHARQALIADHRQDLVPMLSDPGVFLIEPSVAPQLFPTINELSALNREGEPLLLWRIR